MFDTILKTALWIGIVATVAGALASLLVILLTVANTSLGQNLLATRIGRTLLRLSLIRLLAHGLHCAWLYDIAFAYMAQDQSYQEEAGQITKEFASADWEAFRIVEESL